MRTTLLGIVMSTGAAFCTFAQPPRAPQVPLPAGEGKELVEAACVACHQTNLIQGSVGYTEERWRYLTGQMIALQEPMKSTITKYLATHFPPTNERAPKLVPGDTTIAFKEWTPPTLGQRPRDPLQTADGTIWWAGMYASLIGRLNPATGEMKEFKLDPMARPHSIIDDASGNIWYTGNGNGTVGKLEPASGKITVYPMPDPTARDPHTPLFNRDGHLWFTLQNSNMLGRLIPATGEIKLVTMPTQRARPYGIKEDSVGALWIAYNGSHKIARVDPMTWEIREFETPTPAFAAWRSRATTSSGTSTPRAAISAVSIRRPVPSRNGRARAAQLRIPTRSRSSTTSSGTTSRTSGPMRSCASTRRRSGSRAGRSHRASASSGTCA
jgi:sugar lactone lactonase YvrE